MRGWSFRNRRSFVVGMAAACATIAGEGVSGLAAQQPRTAAGPDPFAGKKKVLAIGDARTGYQWGRVRRIGVRAGVRS